MKFSHKDARAVSAGHGMFSALSHCTKNSLDFSTSKFPLLLASAFCLSIQGCAVPFFGGDSQTQEETKKAEVEVGKVDNSQPTIIYSFDADEEDDSEPEIKEKAQSVSKAGEEAKKEALRQQAQLKERERLEKERLKKQQLENARKAEEARIAAAELAEERRVQAALEEAARQKAAQERAAMEKADREAREQERLAVEALDRQEREKAEKAKEIARQAEVARKAQLAAVAKETQAQRQLEAQKVLERQQAEKKRLEQARLEKQKIEQARLERQRLEQARIEQQKIEQERLAKQEEERLAKVEAEKALQQKQEAERIAAAKLQAGVKPPASAATPTPAVAAVTPANSQNISSPKPQLELKPKPKVSLSGDRMDYTKVIGKLVSVPSGKFRMGDLTGKGRSSERPVRNVVVNSFYIMEHEVPYKAWDACVKGGGCSYSPPNDIHGRGQQPVSYVSYNDIVNQFIPWLKKETGIDFRLPSEAEWEYAARAGTKTDFSWGDKLGCDHSRYNAPGCAQAGAAAVKSYLPNAFGLYNVNGNLWEWTQDCWQKNYRGAPSNQAPRSKASCTRASVRGGSWFHANGQLRTASRVKAVMRERYFNVGFRLVMDK